MDIMNSIFAKHLNCDSSGGSGCGLPVVTLTTFPTTDGVKLTDAENAAMNEAFGNGMPVVLHLPTEDYGLITTVAFVMVMANFIMCDVGVAQFQFARSHNTTTDTYVWYATRFNPS